MTDPYREGLLQTVSCYKDNKPLIKSMIRKFDSPLSVLYEVYMILIKGKEIEPIENLPEIEKRRIFDQTAGFKDRVKASKAIYLIELI